MTAEEKNEIVEEIKEELFANIIKKESNSALKPTIDKWRKDPDVYTSKMRKAFDGDGIADYTVWECIRKITCKIMGVSYVRQIKERDMANSVADKLCEIVCELAKEVRKEQNNDS